MPKYLVTRKEIHEQIVEIEAESQEEARQKVSQGEGDNIGETEYYANYNGPEDWDVTET